MTYYISYRHISGRTGIQRAEAKCQSIARELFAAAYGSAYTVERVNYIK